MSEDTGESAGVSALGFAAVYVKGVHVMNERIRIEGSEATWRAVATALQNYSNILSRENWKVEIGGLPGVDPYEIETARQSIWARSQDILYAIDPDTYSPWGNHPEPLVLQKVEENNDPPLSHPVPFPSPGVEMIIES